MNVAMLLDTAADGFGERVAFGSRDGGITFAGMRRLAGGVAERLAGDPAGTVAVLAPNGPLVPVALWGAAWSGRSYAPLNYRLPGDVQAELLARLQPAVVADAAWVEAPAATEGPYPDEPGRPAVLLYTSGTSAAPKAAVLGHDHLVSYVFNTVEFGAAGDDEAVLLAVPPFHVAGVAALLTSTWAGRRIVPLAQFSPEAWLATARAEGVTHAFVVPTMLARIVAHLEAHPEAAPTTLRHLAYGGARMPLPVLERALALFPDTGFVNAYGLTETSSTVAVLGPDDHREAASSTDPAVRRRLQSVGRPVPGVEVAVVDGEILVRGPQVSGAYLGQEGKVDADGWLHTGDRGHLDEAGYLYVEGRADEVIIRGGENISPAEIEDALAAHPAVAAAAVVGLPDLEWGEKVAAMVALRPGATAGAEELRAFVRERLGSLKTPEVIAVREELPHTATGKVLKREIKEELASAVEP
jgi:acyl-CoA synthetase (AMP-forming)/AMP-acid ligase II